MNQDDFQTHMERAEFFAEEAEKAALALEQWMVEWRLRQKKKNDDDLSDERNW